MIRPKGVTTDGQGHVFVTDENNKCIQIFSAGGKYVGVLLKEGQQGLGEPRRVRWNDATSSLVVAHKKDRNIFISVISQH